MSVLAVDLVGFAAGRRDHTHFLYDPSVSPAVLLVGGTAELGLIAFL